MLSALAKKATSGCVLYAGLAELERKIAPELCRVTNNRQSISSSAERRPDL